MRSHSIACEGSRFSHSVAALFVSVCAFAVMEPAPVSAQEVAAAEEDGTRLDEIVVTAQRREQRLQDVPVAVTAFGSQLLEASGVGNVRELTQVAPSLSVPYSSGVYRPFLRGIGNSAGGTVGNEASVPVYIDDVYYSRLSAAYLAINSVERVEVLKGPQGTLFGRNSSGGAIQMFTKDPGVDPELKATIGYANYDTVSGQLYASVPLSDSLGWNIALAGSDQRSGWGKSITTGEDAYLEKYATIRSKLVWDSGNGTRFKLVGFYAYQNGDTGLTQDRHKGSYGATAGVPLPGYPSPQVLLPSLADISDAGFYDTRLNFRNFAKEEGYGGSIRIDQELGFADLVSITAFRNAKGLYRTDSDYSPQNFYNADLGHIDRQFTQEFQLKSKNTSVVDWIIGAYYLRSKSGYDRGRVYGDLLTVAVAPGAVQNIYGIQKISSYSVYGQATTPLTETTNLTVGLRYTDDKVTGIGRQTVTIPGVGTVPAAPDFDGSKTFKRVTWKGAVDHHFSDGLMAYVSVSRGYKAGTFNTLPLDAAPARPEIVDAYEIGIKSELLDRRIRLNSALFWNEIKDPQVITFLTQGNVSSVGLTNAEKARVRGAEVELEAVPAAGLKLRGAVTYLDNEFVKFPDAPYYSLNGMTLVGPVRGDAKGNRLPNVAKWRFSVGANYNVDTNIGEWTADVGLSYTGRFAWNADNRVFEKAVTLVNASLSFTPSAFDWMTIGLWGKNLSNIKYYTVSQQFSGAAGIGGDIAGAAPPRTYGATLSFKY